MRLHEGAWTSAELQMRHAQPGDLVDRSDEARALQLCSETLQQMLLLPEMFCTESSLGKAGSEASGLHVGDTQ